MASRVDADEIDPVFSPRAQEQREEVEQLKADEEVREKRMTVRDTQFELAKRFAAIPGSPGQDELEKMFSKMDKDGTGEISMDAWRNTVRKKTVIGGRLPPNLEELKRAKTLREELESDEDEEDEEQDDDGNEYAYSPHGTNANFSKID